MPRWEPERSWGNTGGWLPAYFLRVVLLPMCHPLRQCADMGAPATCGRAIFPKAGGKWDYLKN